MNPMVWLGGLAEGGRAVCTRVRVDTLVLSTVLYVLYILYKYLYVNTVCILYTCISIQDLDTVCIYYIYLYFDTVCIYYMYICISMPTWHQGLYF